MLLDLLTGVLSLSAKASGTSTPSTKAQLKPIVAHSLVREDEGGVVPGTLQARQRANAGASPQVPRWESTPPSTMSTITDRTAAQPLTLALTNTISAQRSISTRRLSKKPVRR